MTDSKNYVGGNIHTISEINKTLGLTKIYQHDFDDKSKRCKKCHKTVEELEGKLKLCPVIGPEEVANFRDYDER